MKIVFILSIVCLFYSLLRLLFKAQNYDNASKKIVFTVIHMILLVVLESTILSILGYYKLLWLAIFNFVSSIIIYHFGNKISILTIIKRVINERVNTVVLIGIGTACFLYFLFPTTYLLGGRDPGLYFIDGIHIAETGSMQYDSDSYVDENYDDIKEIIDLGYPGLYSAFEYGVSDKPGKIIPQFMPMFPSFLAVGYDLAGIEGLIRINGIIGIACLLAIYYFVKEFFGKKAALISFLFLLCNPAQIWNARITQTELLCQLFFFMALYYIGKGWDEERKLYALFGGFLIGISSLNRIDVYILGVGIFLTYIYCSLFNIKKIKYARRIMNSYVVCMILSLVYGYLFSYPYMYDHWNNGTLSQIVLLNLALYILANIFGLSSRFFKNRSCVKNIYFLIANNKNNMFIFTGILLVVFLFTYFIRPLCNPDSFNNNSLVEFCFYTSFFAFPFAIIGIFNTFYKLGQKQEKLLPFFLISGVSLVIYIIRPSITPDHIWASRRWIMVNIPFILILAAVGISCIKIKFSVGIRGFIITYFIGFFLFQSQGFIFEKNLNGITTGYEKTALSLSDDKIYFTFREEIASVLRYVYGKKVYILNNDKENLINYLEKNERILLVGEENDLKSFNIQLKKESSSVITGKMLEKTFGKMPYQLEDRTNGGDVYEVSLLPLNTKMNVDLNSLFISEASEYISGEGIQATGKPGYLFFGPYYTIMKGTYEIEFEIDNKENNDYRIEVTGKQGEIMISSLETNEDGFVKLIFKNDSYLEGVELRLAVNSGSTLKCKAISIKKLN